jgi:ABC-type transporter Mla subunit MlaD
MTINRYALVGILFLVAIVLLGLVTIKVSSFTEILGEDPRVYTILFEASSQGLPQGSGQGGVGGLKRGDAVLVAGVPVGRVVEVQLQAPDQEEAGKPKPFVVAVTIHLRSNVVLRKNPSVRIVDASLLGGKRIEIDPGTGPASSQTTLRGSMLPSALEALGEVVDRNRDNISRIVKNVSEITSTVTRGDGTMGRLFMDSELHDRMVSVVDRTDRILKTVEEGPGLVRALLHDRQIKSDIQVAVQSARTLFEDAASGRGSLGRFLTEEGPYNKFREIMDGVHRVVTRIERGDGLIGALVSDEILAQEFRDAAAAISDQETPLGMLLFDRQLARDMKGMIRDLREITAHVNEGKGTVGRLLKDDKIALGLEGAVTALTGTINEAREAAPVNAFLQTLFIWW